MQLVIAEKPSVAQSIATALGVKEKAYHPETGCRAYAEKTRPYYAIEGKTAPLQGASGAFPAWVKD